MAACGEWWSRSRGCHACAIACWRTSGARSLPSPTMTCGWTRDGCAVCCWVSAGRRAWDVSPGSWRRRSSRRRHKPSSTPACLGRRPSSRVSTTWAPIAPTTPSSRTPPGRSGPARTALSGAPLRSSSAAMSEALGPGTIAAAGEELEFFLRVIQAGWTLAYEPSAIVWHRHRRDMEEPSPADAHVRRRALRLRVQTRSAPTRGSQSRVAHLRPLHG